MLPATAETIIKANLVAREMTREQLAAELKLSGKKLRMALRGLPDLSLVVTRRKICNFLNLDAQELYPRDSTYIEQDRRETIRDGGNPDLKWLLEWNGISLRSIAVEMKVHKKKVYDAVSMSGETPPKGFVDVRVWIANKLNKPYFELWGVSLKDDREREHKPVIGPELHPTHSRLMAALGRRGYTMLDLSKRYGLSYSTLLRASQGRYRTIRIHKIIAKEIGSTLEELWPHLYKEVIEGTDTINLRSTKEITSVFLGWLDDKEIKKIHQRLKETSDENSEDSQPFQTRSIQ